MSSKKKASKPKDVAVSLSQLTPEQALYAAMNTPLPKTAKQIKKKTKRAT